MTLRPLKYATAADWQAAPHKRVAFMGMSGLGKTYLSNTLRETGAWYHYSVDYRIGTRYMGEHIVDEFKRAAMATPMLREMLLSDSIEINSKIRFENLRPLSNFMGKPGAQAQGGMEFEEYMRRQALHREAEIAAMRDVASFIERAQDTYNYPNFVCDTSGSVCEVVDPEDAQDPVLSLLAEHALIIWIEGSAADTQTLCERFSKAPKPMYTRPEQMRARWQRYLTEMDATPQTVDPDAFIRWSFREIVDERIPLYRAIATNWGITLQASDVAQLSTAQGVVDLISSALAAR